MFYLLFRGFRFYFLTLVLLLSVKSKKYVAHMVRPVQANQIAKNLVRELSLLLTTTNLPKKEGGTGWWRNNFLCEKNSTKCSYVWVGIGIVLLSILLVVIIVRNWYKADRLEKKIAIANSRYELKQVLPHN